MKKGLLESNKNCWVKRYPATPMNNTFPQPKRFIFEFKNDKVPNALFL